jgi:site-specific DNA-methyltransferase (cytosine-N4-specific)
VLNIDTFVQDGEMNLYIWDLLLHLTRNVGFKLLMDYAWIKPTVMPGGNAARYTRPRRGFEYLWHFGKTTKVKADTREILMKYSQGTKDQMADVARRQTHDFRITPSGHNWDVDRMCKDRGGATPLNYLVASFNDATAEHMLKWKEMGIDIHPARYPEDLVAYFVVMLTKPGDLVCDPFSGSGTTASVARKLQRHFICGDVAPEYVRAGKIRVATARSTIKHASATWKTFDEFEP